MLKNGLMREPKADFRLAITAAHMLLDEAGTSECAHNEPGVQGGAVYVNDPFG